jgi:hypothetical protein
MKTNNVNKSTVACGFSAVGIVAAVILAAGILATVSCGQDPVFYIISKETKPIPPLIQGSPTGMVVFERVHPDHDDPVPILYVASGRVHWYASPSADGVDASWDLEKYEIEQPTGQVISIAAVKDYLYALCLTGQGVDTVLWRIGHEGTAWEEVANSASDEYPLIQSVYADPLTNRLFAGAGKNDRTHAVYGILYLDEVENTLRILKSDTKIFSGVIYHEAEDMYFLCTRGSGIFQVSEAEFAVADLARTAIGESAIVPLDDNSDISDENKNANRMFMGMIRLEDDMIVAVERNGGALYAVENGSFRQITYASGEVMATGKYATGALALWEGSGWKMLITGIQGGLYNTTTSSYTHGYVEFDLDSGGSLNTASFRHDPGNLRSVSDNDRYKATIGKHPINHLYQALPIIDDNMTFFASTQTTGLWSYRDRPNNGGLQWNAEAEE